MKTRPHHRRTSRGLTHPWRALVAATVGLAGVIAVPQAAGADEPTVIVCDTDNDTPGIDCDGTTVNLSTPDYGPGLKTIDPARVWDSRTANARLAAGGMVTVPIAGQVGVPANATAVMANIAVVNPDAPGHITAYPCNTTRPTAAMLTHIGGETRSGSTLVQLDTTGNLCLYSHAAADITVDIQGYIADSQNPATFTPTRVLDTRTDGGPITGSREFQVADLTELASVIDLPEPDEIAGLWLNISTFLAPAPGYVSVDRPSSIQDGRTSSLNFDAGRVQTNLVFVPLLAGKFTVFTSSTTGMTIDVVGADMFPDGIVPLPANRLFDSRPGRSETPARLQPGVPTEILVLGPSQDNLATAALVNIAVVNPSGPTHITAYPCGQATPTVANANAGAGTILANAALVPVGENNSICVVSVAETDLVVDAAAIRTSAPLGVGSCSFSAPPKIWHRVTGGVPPYTLTGTLPDDVSVEYTSGLFVINPPQGATLILDRELTITDAVGTQVPLQVQLSDPPPIPETC